MVATEHDGAGGGVPRWRLSLAWAVILLSTAYFVITSAREKAGGGAQRSTYVEQELPARYVIGFHVLKLGADTTTEQVGTIQASAKTEPEIVRAAIVMGELQGADAAQAMLRKLPRKPTPEIALDAEALRHLYTGETLTAADKARLITRHGWFGELAEAYGKPPEDGQRKAVLRAARQTFLVMLATAFLALGGLALGLVALAAAIVLLVMGKISRRYQAVAADAAGVGMLEGFACYLALMAVLTVAGRWIPVSWPRWTRFVDLLALMPIVLIFTRMRGVTWRAMAQRGGLTRGQGVLWEMGCGVAGYIAGLPIVALGMLVTAALVKAGGVDASHPITEAVAGADKWQWLLLWGLACAWAPLTEEFMFRGMFFGALRGRWNWWASAAVVSLIFAALHPQGWAAIPLLGSLAMVLAAMREWRGSLIAGMTAHALNNAIMLGFLMLCVQ